MAVQGAAEGFRPTFDDLADPHTRFGNAPIGQSRDNYDVFDNGVAEWVASSFSTRSGHRPLLDVDERGRADQACGARFAATREEAMAAFRRDLIG